MRIRVCCRQVLSIFNVILLECTIGELNGCNNKNDKKKRMDNTGEKPENAR
jgi:hypothetical protein